MKFGDLYIGKYVLLKGAGLTPDKLMCVVGLDVLDDPLRPWKRSPGVTVTVTLAEAPVTVRKAEMSLEGKHAHGRAGGLECRSYVPGSNFIYRYVELVRGDPADTMFGDIAEVPWAYEEVAV